MQVVVRLCFSWCPTVALQSHRCSSRPLALCATKVLYPPHHALELVFRSSACGFVDPCDNFVLVMCCLLLQSFGDRAYALHRRSVRVLNSQYFVTFVSNLVVLAVFFNDNTAIQLL